MAMIPLAGGELALTRESFAKHRLNQSSQEGDDSYLQADALAQEELQGEPVTGFVQAPVTDEVQGEQLEGASEQLQAFSRMLPSFVLLEERVQQSVSGAVSPIPSQGAVPPAQMAEEVALTQPPLSFRGLQQRTLLAEQGSVAFSNAAPQLKESALPGQDASAAPVAEQARAAGDGKGAVREGVQARLISTLQPMLNAQPQSGEREPVALDPKLMVLPTGQLAPSKPAEYQWAPVKLPDNQTQWGQQLMSLLHDKVELQVNQQVKQAHIRLDPPELGRLELTVRVEGDRLNVQLNATNPAVRDALIQSMERLRMSLAPHHSGGVDVNVGQGREQNPKQRWQGDEILAGRQQWRDELEQSGKSRPDWLNTLV